ncbi:MAG: hypothetical protein LBT89_02540, partial [Planctomycetaceae bacterium]|nr:hypothetical protein [Planctomycetaceae bacterium]
AVAIDSLQLALRYIQNEETKQCIRKTLDYLYTDFSLHWYRKGLRLAGAQSRTYQYQIGVSAHTTRLAAFAGLGPIDRQAKYAAMLNSFRAVYQPPKSITDLNQIYPRYVQRRWGSKAEQSAALMMYEDIALGTAGTGYGSRHDMPLTVDLPDDDTTEDLTHRHFLPRCYFIADGRSDPYGIKKEPAGKAGHPKALHLDALWSAAQRTFETVADVSYPPEIRQTAESVQSVFVLRKTDSVQAEQDTFIFRYNKAAVIIRILESAEPPVLTTDESALRLTVPHRKEDGDKPLRFSLRIESQHSPERTNMPEPADVPMPVGVLSLNGRELARPILEEIPFVKRFAEELRNAPAVKITDTAIWQADSAVSTLPCSAPPCMPIRQQVHWKMQVDRADTYYLWCYVWAKDNEHDSVFMQLAEERQPLSFMERWNTAWHLGSGVQYRWVCFPQPLKLSAGAWRLTFLPRETDVCIKHLYITTQPQDCPVQQ